MADIKTKDNAKGTIRTIDKAAVATQRMKQAYIATKEKAERSVNANSSSAEEYAFGRGFRHGNVNADSRSGNQSGI